MSTISNIPSSANIEKIKAQWISKVYHELGHAIAMLVLNKMGLANGRIEYMLISNDNNCMKMTNEIFQCSLEELLVYVGYHFMSGIVAETKYRMNGEIVDVDVAIEEFGSDCDTYSDKIEYLDIFIKHGYDAERQLITKTRSAMFLTELYNNRTIWEIVNSFAQEIDSSIEELFKRLESEKYVYLLSDQFAYMHDNARSVSDRNISKIWSRLDSELERAVVNINL